MTTAPPGWLSGARTAPSAHNTQPWRFRLLPEGIRVGWTAQRALPAADPTDRDLYLALGASIEGAALKSALAGRPLLFVADNETENVSESENVSGDEKALFIGKLVDDSGAATSESDLTLARFLEARHTARINHLPEPVPQAVLDAMSQEAEKYGCRVFFLSAPADLKHLGALSRDATASQLADPAIYDELWNWMRLDKSDPRYHRDGLTADTLNLSDAATLAARTLLKPSFMRGMVKLQLHQFVAMDTESLVRHSASLCLLTTPDLKRNTLLECGRLLLRLWLIAAKAGLTTHPVSALLDCAETIGPTAAAFGATKNGSVAPAAVFRLGKTKPVPRAPRLPADELLLPP